MEKDKKSSFGKYILILTIIVLLTGVLVYSGYNKALQNPNSDNSETVSFEIKEGTPVNTILDI